MADTQAQVRIRGYKPGDEAPVVALWNRCLPADTIHKDLFVARVLLDVNFDPNGFLVAEQDGHPVGFLLAVTRSTPMHGLDNDPDDGWITVFFVDSAYRGRGIGRMLLEQGRAHIATQGRRWVSVSPYAPNYFWPGVDPNLRGIGLGKVLLYRCLDQMRSQGLHNAWFLWTGLDEPAGYLYTRVGFHVSRQFAVMRASASAPEGR